MNAKRREIWNKSGGKCWYCGCELPEKGWHEDHFEPIGRLPPKVIHEIERVDGRVVSKRFEEKRAPLHPERDHYDNLVPACASCNLLKGMGSIEGFRNTIRGFIDSLNKYANQYKFAKKYGLIIETDNPVVFWFEKQTGKDGSA